MGQVRRGERLVNSEKVNGTLMGWQLPRGGRIVAEENKASEPKAREMAV